MPSELPTNTPVPPQVVDAALHHWGDSGRQSTFTVSGRSMEPCLFAGDRLLIRHGRENIHIGGLIAYRQDDTLVVHRLLRIFTLRGERVMLLRGDNNDRPDPLIPIDKLVGRATAVMREDRIYRIDTPLWRGASLLIALLARFPVTLEQWLGRMRRRWFPDRHAAAPTRVIVRAFALPGHFLIRLLWKLSPYAPL